METGPTWHAAIALLFAAGVLSSGFGSPTIVSTSAYSLATAYNSETKLAVDPAGNLFMAFTYQSTNGSFWVRVAESSNEGASWSDLQGMPSTANSSRAALAIGPRGEVDLVWTGGVAPKKSGYASSQIYFSSYEGGSWSHPTLLSNTKWYSGYPSLAVDGAGRVHVVWYGFDGEFYQIFYTEFNGSAWSAPLDLTNAREDSVNPAIGTGPGGVLDVAWYGQYSRYYQVWYAQFNGTWSAPRTVSASANDSLNPSLLVGPDGTVNLAWATELGNSMQIFRASGAGSSWGKPVQLTDGAQSSENPTQVLAPNGSLYLFWDTAGGIRGCNASTGCEQFAVYSDGFNSYPSAFGLRSGGIALTWTHSASHGGGPFSVFYLSSLSEVEPFGFVFALAIPAVLALFVAVFVVLRARAGRPPAVSGEKGR